MNTYTVRITKTISVEVAADDPETAKQIAVENDMNGSYSAVWTMFGVDTLAVDEKKADAGIDRHYAAGYAYASGYHD